MSQCHSTSRLATLSVTVSLYQLQEEEELLKQYSGRHSVSGHFTRDARSLLPPTLLLRLLKPAPPIFPNPSHLWLSNGLAMEARKGLVLLASAAREFLAALLSEDILPARLSPGKKGGAWWPGGRRGHAVSVL